VTAGGRFHAAAAHISAAIADRVTPAAVVEVGTSDELLWTQSFGALTYSASAPPCTLDTIFDLASLTKVIATASLAMRAVESGAIHLDWPVAALVPEWQRDEQQPATIRALLDHSSGLPAHLRLFEIAGSAAEFRRAICSAPIAYQTGTQSIYSDPGFMLLGFILEAATGRTLDQQFKDVVSHVNGPLTFRPPPNWRDRIAPTEDDPWRGRVVQGEVHDENAAALGGVAAHAGLFGTAAAVGQFARAILSTLKGDTWLSRRSTLAEFVQKSAVPGSSRALGWDTMLPTSSCGTRMSARAIGHTGFTGTSLWIDPEKDLYVVLLTNRVHPSRAGEGIQPLRRSVHDAVMDSVR
jgi:CubicO group peptidase (beta-lactamase class C family)